MNSIGIAFDIGTTTIAAQAVDISSGKTLKSATVFNPQASFGGDVLSRVKAVTEDEGLLKNLQSSIINICNELIIELSDGAKIIEITVAGNTVMEHIFLGVTPKGLGKVPYKPVFKEARRELAKDLGFNVSSETLLYTFPIIGGFVGGDTVAVILSTGMHKSSKTELAIDLGTNSEIVLKSAKGIYTAASPAGPAFEGGEISSGMTAGKGAIEGVTIEGDCIKLEVIGGSTPIGICGSGLIDAVGAFVREGLIDSTGRIVDSSEVTNNLATKIKVKADGNAIELYRGAKGSVQITQADIRALQFAKAALRAGTQMLLQKAKLSASDIDIVYIAGTFGSHLNKDGLKEVGILEEAWLDKVTVVGDGALEGAICALLSEENKKAAEKIAAESKYVSLSGSKNFEKEFIERMNF